MPAIFNLSKHISIRRKLRKSQTPQEVVLWSRIKNNQLGYKFRRQHSIGRYIVDFYCPEKHLVIELDGSQHIDNQDDTERDKYLNNLNIRVLRFWDNDVNNNLEGVLLKIQEYLKNNLTYPSPLIEGRSPKGGGVNRIWN